MPPIPPPRNEVAAHIERGITLHRSGRIAEAVAAFETGIHLSPTHATAQLHAGVANLQLSRWQRGVEHLRVAVAADPSLAEAWSNLAFGWRELGRIDDARGAVEKALALDPTLADAWNLLGLVSQDQQRLDEARTHFEHALRLRPDMALARMNLANCDQALGDIDAALAGYRAALALDPQLAEVHYNLGHLAHKAGRLDEALVSYRTAIRLRPNYTLAHHNLSHALFLLGRFGEAWKEHAWRPPRLAHAAKLGYDTSPIPLQGKRLRVLGEQGLGDVLFFLRFAAALREKGAVLEFAGDSRLLPMLERTGLFSRVAATPEELRREAATEVLAGDLPLLLEDPGIVPPPLPLEPRAERLATAEMRLRELGPPPHVALAWRAGEPKTGLHETLYKQISPDELGYAFRDVKATLIAVQREPVEGEIAAIADAAGRTVFDGSFINRDIEDALAWMSAVGALVCVSNTNVHLRAGLAQPGHVLVPFPPEWRWMASGSSPWFPTFTVHRQDPAGSWRKALEDVSQHLAVRFGTLG